MVGCIQGGCRAESCCIQASVQLMADGRAPTAMSAKHNETITNRTEHNLSVYWPSERSGNKEMRIKHKKTSSSRHHRIVISVYHRRPSLYRRRRHADGCCVATARSWTHFLHLSLSSVILTDSSCPRLSVCRGSACSSVQYSVAVTDSLTEQTPVI